MKTFSIYMNDVYGTFNTGAEPIRLGQARGKTFESACANWASSLKKVYRGFYDKDSNTMYEQVLYPSSEEADAAPIVEAITEKTDIAKVAKKIKELELAEIQRYEQHLLNSKEESSYEWSVKPIPLNILFEHLALDSEYQLEIMRQVLFGEVKMTNNSYENRNLSIIAKHYITTLYRFGKDKPGRFNVSTLAILFYNRYKYQEIQKYFQRKNVEVEVY